MGGVTLGIVIPLVALPIVLALVWRWYSRTVRAPADTKRHDTAGVRLTAETLHRLPTPPWRVVYEIGDRLSGIDHVVVGPAGVLGIRSRLEDRPVPEQLGDPAAVGRADPAIARAELDALLAPVAVRSIALAHVFWGAPDNSRLPAETTLAATPYVEGQRLVEWLTGQEPATLDPARVDAAWRAVVLGIGRPDPFS